MKEMEKLKVLLAHWIEHNAGHEAECGKWAEYARNEGNEQVAGYIDGAVKAMEEADALLRKALEAAGGAVGEHHHGHHHHGHHHHD